MNLLLYILLPYYSEHTINYTDKSETIETPKFMDTINPLLSFSNDDINAMNEDFDQFFESDTSSDEEPVDIGEIIISMI